MFPTIDAFYEAAKPLLEAFDHSYIRHFRPVAEVDHLGYKCESHEEFEHIRRLFESVSPYLYQSIISNRLIAIIKLPKPISTCLGDIWFLELSDQKPDLSQTSRFDHIEIFSLRTHMQDRARRLAHQCERRGMNVIQVTRPHHTTFDIVIENGFVIRIEDEPLIEKIKREEMK